MKITILIAAIILFASGVFVQPEQFAKGSTVLARPQATPEKPLDAEAVAALLEELKDDLPNFVDNEDTVTAIIEKWDTRKSLAGRPKMHILKILIDDIWTFVKDREIRNEIAESWGVEDRVVAATPVKTPIPPQTVTIPVPNPKPQYQGTCRPQGAAIKSNRSGGFAFINAAYRAMFATGTVRCFDEAKGFGFITQDGDGTDIFVHHSAINMDGVRTLQEGQKVQYELVIGPKGQRSAANVRPA